MSLAKTIIYICVIFGGLLISVWFKNEIGTGICMLAFIHLCVKVVNSENSKHNTPHHE